MRTGAVGLLLLALSGLVAAPAGSAAAAPATASATATSPAVTKRGTPSLAELRAEVARTSKQLAKGAAAWDRGQAQLGVQVQRKVDADRALEELQVRSVVARDQMAELANALYRNPVSPVLTASLAGDSRLLTDTLYLRRRLNQDQQSVRDSTELLATRATQAEAILAQREAAARAVTRLQGQLDAQLARLQAEASATHARLQKLLAQMRAQEAARLLAAGGGATCSSGLPAMSVNGFLPESVLCPLRTAPGHRLANGAAQAFDAMSTAFAADTGKPLCVSDSYRDYAGQVDVFRRKPELAATPGRSNHGWGRAVDLCGGVQTFGSPAYQWLKARSTEFGFFHPGWAEPGGSRPEPWHWEYPG